MRRLITPALLTTCLVGAGLGLGNGCTLIAQVDRSKIPDDDDGGMGGDPGGDGDGDGDGDGGMGGQPTSTGGQGNIAGAGGAD